MNQVLSMNEDERKALGLKAKEKVLSLFSMDQINQKLVSFLTIFFKKVDICLETVSIEK